MYTHKNQRALFYSDLLQGKTVLINFMSVKNDDVYPVTQNLAKVHRVLGAKMGREVFMYSITVDPEHDTPEVLHAFANKRGVGPGWLFLTGEPKTLELVKGSLFIHGHHGHGHRGHDCSMGLVRYGNEAVGTWGSVPAKSSPEWIAARCAWVTPAPIPKGPPVRKGRKPLA